MSKEWYRGGDEAFIPLGEHVDDQGEPSSKEQRQIVRSNVTERKTDMDDVVSGVKMRLDIHAAREEARVVRDRVWLLFAAPVDDEVELPG